MYLFTEGWERSGITKRKREVAYDLDVALEGSLSFGGGTINLHGLIVRQVADPLLDLALEFMFSSTDLSPSIFNLLLSISARLLSGSLCSQTRQPESLTDGLLGASDSRVGAVLGSVLESFSLCLGVRDLLSGLGFGFLAGTVGGHVGVAQCLADGLLGGADVLVGGVGEAFSHFGGGGVVVDFVGSVDVLVLVVGLMNGRKGLFIRFFFFLQ